ncbi:MAG: restriction endonuclease subunit S [Thiomicrorhabdus sp.]|nr:restriction endonuclease subunit S [Thiomicrorhabdus sp.]
MSSVIRRKLGDIADSCLGKMLDREKNKGTFHPYLANYNVRWGEFDLSNVQEMKFEDHEHERYGLQYGDLVICEGGEPGRCAVWRDNVPDMKIQKALHRLRVKRGFSYDFLYYRILLANRTSELQKYFIGSTIKHLTGVSLKQVEFDFPCHEEQVSIATVLRSLDKKIELNNRINAELEAMAKTLYDYWFVQFDFPDANGKPYKTSGGKMVFNPTLKREIPEGWEPVSVGKIVDIKTGKEDANYATERGKYHFFTCGESALRCDDFVFEGKAVLLAGNGSFSVKRYEGKFNAYQRTYVLIPKQDELYAPLYFAVNDKVKTLTSGSRGSIVKFITKGDIEDIYLPLPTNRKLEFVKTLNVCFKESSRLYEQDLELVSLRDWLLPMLMNGQVTVGEAS